MEQRTAPARSERFLVQRAAREDSQEKGRQEVAVKTGPQKSGTCHEKKRCEQELNKRARGIRLSQRKKRKDEE